MGAPGCGRPSQVEARRCACDDGPMIAGDLSLGRAGRLALLAAGLALGLLSLAIIRGEPAYSLAGDATATAAAGLLAGWSLVTAGVGSWARRPGSRFGPLLAGAGLAWFLAEWDNPGAGVTLAFTAGLVLQAACPPLVGHAALAYPGGRLRSRLDGAAVAVAYGGAVLGLGILPALFFNPAATGCGQCPGNLLGLGDDAEVVRALNRVGVWLGLAWAVLLVVLAGWRLLRSTAARRRLLAPVLVPAIVYLTLVAWAFQHALGRGFLSNDAVDRRLWLGQAVALVALALGVSWEWVRGRRTRTVLARLVVELAASPPPGGLGAALAKTLDDPSLTLLYPLSDGRQVDADGRPVRPGQEQAVTPLLRDGRPVALLAHRPGLLDTPGLVEEITTAVRLTLDNERLQAEVHAQLEDLRASRARIVERGDAERRRLERDLHDGAQQRLVALALSLRLARLGPDAGTDVAALEEAEAEVSQALAELRELAHGLYPAALTEEGLGAALEALAEQTPSPLALGRLPQERFEPNMEAAAYFVVAETLKRSQPRRATVDAARADGRLVVEVQTDQQPPQELTDLEDRVGALEGRLVVQATPQGGTRIRAELPCG
jgi:signal transduction histidine kinase